MDFFRVAKRNRVTLVLAIVAALATVLISEAAYWRSVHRLNDIGEMLTARLNIQRLERSLLDAETGQRGYLLTARKEYLEPYQASLANITECFKSLDDYYGDEALPKTTLLKMHAMVDTKLSELALTISLRDQGRPRP